MEQAELRGSNGQRRHWTPGPGVLLRTVWIMDVSSPRCRHFLKRRERCRSFSSRIASTRSSSTADSPSFQRMLGFAEDVPEIRHSHAMCKLALTAISTAGTSCRSGQIRSSKRQRDRCHISRTKQGTLQKPAASCQNLPLEFFSCLIRAVRILHCQSPIFRAEAWLSRLSRVMW